MSIYAPPIDISDPESGEELGTYHHLKTNVQVERVEKRFSIVGPVPIRRQISKPASPANLFQQYQPQYKLEKRNLSVAEGEVEPLPGGAAIQVGDSVFVTVPDPTEEEKESSGDSEDKDGRLSEEKD